MQSALSSFTSAARSRKLVIGVGIVSLAAIAWAATNWGPFLMKPYFPTVTYGYDMETHFIHAGKVPTLVMNKYVLSIKKGDRVRIVYPDGAVWDFEVQLDCSLTAPCPFENPVKAANVTAPTQPTNYEVAYWRQDTCPWDSGYKDIPTGYWASKTVQTGENEFTQSAWYVDTGTKSVYIKGSGCK